MDGACKWSVRLNSLALGLALIDPLISPCSTVLYSLGRLPHSVQAHLNHAGIQMIL